MKDVIDIIQNIRDTAKKKILYLPHALRQMARPDRMISIHEIRKVVEQGKIIEDYPNDPRGHSCLIFRFTDNDRPVHVVCSPKEDYLAIITAYVPGTAKWENNFKVRI